MLYDDLLALIPDEALCDKVLTLFNSELKQRDQKIAELQDMLERTVETLHGDVREKLRLEEELKNHSDGKFRVAAELAGDYIYEAIIDDGKICALYASQGFTELTGYTIDDINREGWQHYIHPDDLPAVQQTTREMAPHKSARFEYRIRCKDGRTIWLRDFSQPVFDEQGRLVKLIGFSRNITAEKEASLALQRKRQLLDTLLNTVPMGICFADEDGTLLGVNKTLAELLGYEKSELLGKHFSMVLPEEYREYATEAHRTFMAGDSLITTSEMPVQRKDGTRRWVRISARKFQRDDGKWYRVTATEDITEERQEREEKNNLLDLLARTQAMTHIGSWEFDFQAYRFTQWSDELFRIYERPIELGPPTAEEYGERYLTPEVNQSLQNFVLNLISKGAQAEGEIELPITTHTGGHKIIRIRQIIMVENGQPTFAQGMTQDITREKMLEQQKEALTKQLIQAQKLEAIGTLAGGIAHEFNNILAGMLGNVRLLEQKFAQEPKAQKYIDRLITLNHRAATIVSQMLGFARQGKYEIQSLSLKACVDNISQILLTTTDRRIRFHLNTAGDVPMIQGDPVQIEQVILNLAKNAIDAIEPLLGKSREHGHIEFELAYEPIPERFQSKMMQKSGTMPMVMLKISDNGEGIPEEIQHKIFEPFFTTKPVGKGTGLGLPMVYGIVQNHNGYLFLESEVGKGTSFYLYFPAVSTAVREPSASVANQSLDLSGLRVLVIDDEAQIREMLAEHLSEFGAEVTVAENGQAGIDAFRTLPKENLFVILDLNMPDMSGEQVLKVLREIDSTVRVLIGTGYLENEQKMRLNGFGATQVLTKPYSLDDIANVLLEFQRVPQKAI